MQLSAELYTTGRMDQILKLAIFLTVCCAVRGQCDGLTVYDGDNKVDTGTVCIRQYKKSECIGFYDSFNQSLLPVDFPKSNLSVDRPRGIHVKGIETPLVENSLDYVYPGLSIQWKPPKSGTSRSSCYGYLVAWFIKDNLTMCQLFHINKRTEDTLRFVYNVKMVSQKSVFDVRVYSMPTDGPESKEDYETFVSTQIATPVAYVNGTPSDWAPFVAYDVLNNGTIKVTISLPPPNFNITEFQAYLDDAELRTVDQVDFSTDLRTEENTEFSLLITAKSSGFYTVVVWARDKFHMQENLCQCWFLQNSNRTCKNLCGGTRTSLFYVNITNPPTVIPVTPPATTVGTTLLPTTENPTLTPENKPDVLNIILGVVITFVVLLALIILCVCLFRKRSRVKGYLQRIRRRYPHREDFDRHLQISESLPVEPLEGSAPRLSKKTVYLVSADDHEAHVSLVEAFAVFLEVHCHCNVILPSRRDPYETGAYEWFIRSISQSDYIMFVDSKGAKKMIHAHIHNKSCTNRKVGPEGDLFIFSLKHILYNSEVRANSLILVSFDGNHCHAYLEFPQCFTLPKHLRNLLKRIHGIGSSEISSYNKVLPLNTENIQKLPEGELMLAACKYVKVYEENNPQYLENNFGDLKDIKPQCDRVLSIDSGDSGNYDGLDSVSQQGIFPGSPTAGPEHVHYPSPQVYFLGVTNKLDYKDAISNTAGSVYTNGLSCFTIKEVREQMDEIKPEPDLDNFSVIPPESQIICDSNSTAFADINRNNYDDDEGIDEDYYQPTIIPPENPLDIQLDTVSSAFADINVNTDKLLFKGETNFLFEDEVLGSLSQFDAVSI